MPNLIGQVLDLLLYKITFVLLIKLSSAMWKVQTTNQRGSLLQQISPHSALHYRPSKLTLRSYALFQEGGT